MKTDALLFQPWHSDFSRALMLSVAAVVVWTGLLTALRSHKSEITKNDKEYSITDCLISNDGRHALVTYWRSEDRRKALHYGLARIDLRPRALELTVVPTTAGLRRLTAGPQDAAFAVDTAGHTSLHDLANGKQLAMKSTCLPVGCPEYVAISPDGRLLITWDVTRLMVFDLVQKKILWKQNGSEVTAAVFHPQAGLFAASRGQIVELSLETGLVVQVLAERQERIRQIAVDARGARIAWLDWVGGLEVCRLSDGRSLWVQKSHGAETLPVTHRPFMYSGVLTFSPDGRYLATCAFEGEWVIAVWSAPSGDRLKSLRGHDKVVHGATFLADGSLASWGRDGTFRIWNVKRGAVRHILSTQDWQTG